jgi:hypothetical protein
MCKFGSLSKMISIGYVVFDGVRGFEVSRGSVLSAVSWLGISKGDQRFLTSRGRFECRHRLQREKASTTFINHPGKMNHSITEFDV